MTDLPPLETEPRSTESPGPSDAELITAVRSGRTAAFGPLYDRHVGAARALARQLTRDPNEAEDLVSEAFAKVLAVVQAGGGPDVAFRAYLLTALRRNAYDRTRAGNRVQVSDDMTAYDPGVPFVDPALEGLERSIVSRAYTSLPERWQTVLWHTEVEGLSPAQVAPLLGLTANGVAALAYRAREGLRQAYLQQHLTGPLEDDCRPYSDRLGAYARGGLSKRETAQVESHLETCARCRGLVLELTDVGSGMRAVIAPLVLGLAVAGYLSSGALLGTGGAAGAATLAGSGGGAGVGGGAGGASGGAAAAGTAGAGGAGAAAAAAAGVVGAGVLTAAAVAGARPAAAATGAGGPGGAGGAGGGGTLGGGPGSTGGAGGALPGVTVTASGGSSSGLFGLAGGGWVAGAAAAAVGLVGAGIVAAVVIGGGGGGDHTTGAPPAASGPVLPGGGASSGTPTATSGSGGATSSSVTGGTPTATATATPTTTTTRSTATARPSISATATPSPTTSPTTSPSGSPTGSPSGSPSGSPTGTTSPSPSPSPTNTGKTTLVVTYTALGDLVQGRPGVIGFSIDNTGHSAAGLITADIALPSGVQFVGQQTSGAALHQVANLSPSGAWSCEGTDTGASCTRNALLAGETTQVYLDVDAQAGSAGTTPVTVTVSSSGLDSVTVGSARGVQAGGLAARYAATGPLKVTEVGNGLLSCPTAEVGCADARQGTGIMLDDDDWSMTPYNQAGDQTTASSAVDLQLPAGATVRWAGLYWSGGFVPGSTQETMKLRGPSSADYATVTAEQTDMGTQSSWQVFQSYADVTDLVAAGGSGTWWGADPQVLAGTSKYAGWSLVVVYDDPTAPQDQVTVFDGLAAVANDGQPQSFVLAPRASGKARIGTVAWEGDLGISGDAISLDGTDLVPQGGTQDPANVTDSSAAGAIGPTNTFGTDVDSFWADMASDSNPVVSARTTGDAYFLGVLTVSDR